MGIVEQVQACLRSGHYSRALDLLRSRADELHNAKRSELEKLAQDGIQRNTEAQRLITESQEFFAQQKASEALQLLRQAYELDKKNSLARSILANALVEHAQSLVESDWLEAERLTNQALAVNPAHPTAKTILHLIVKKKETSPVDDWAAHASKLQSSGDLFGALAWVAEGLAVHPNEPRLQQIQEAIQRDQAARRRQTRRRDMDDLRRMELEIKAATDATAKQALAERIQAVVARYWTDGEILAIANALLLRLGLLGATASAHKGAPIIFHVPRPNAPKPSSNETSQVSPNQIPKTKAEVLDNKVSEAKVAEAKATENKTPPNPVLAEDVSAEILPADTVDSSHVEPNKVTPSSAAPEKLPATLPEPQHSVPKAAVAVQPSSAAVNATSASSAPEPQPRANSKMLLVVSGAAAIILVATTFFFTRKHYAASAGEKTEAAAPSVSAPVLSAPAASESAVSTSASSVAETAPAQTTPGSPLPVASDKDAEKFTPLQPTIPNQSSEPSLNLSTSKRDAQNSPEPTAHIRKDQQAKLASNPPPQPQPQPHLASLIIQGGIPGATVLVDQTSVGIIQPDGTLTVSTVNPGDHTVELRKERFKPRLFKEHFAAGGAISLAAADAALEAAPGELKITFTPTDASVAIVKGDSLAMVHSGVPLSLPAGTYTLTMRTADRFTRSSTLDIIAGQSKALDLSLASNGMSKWENPTAWKQEGDAFTRKGGDFVLYGVAPSSGTFVFSAMPAKGRVVQWVLNYTDSKNYILFQIDDENFHRMVIHNGEKKDEIIVPDKGEKKSFRALRIHASPTEVVHQVQHGNSWTILDRWAQPGADLSLGKFGFYIPGNDQVELSGFAYYADLNIR